MYQIPLVIRKKIKNKKKYNERKNLKYNLYQHYNNGLSNLSVDKIYSTDAFSIALLKKFSLFGFPNKRVLTILSSFLARMFASVVIICQKGLSLNIKICEIEKK